MSCNPAIGGVGKGQIVREIDALGGGMGLAIDAAGIQFRMLNRSKGPAMHGPRAQADKLAYQREIRRILESQPGLTLLQDTAEDLIVEEGREERGERREEQRGLGTSVPSSPAESRIIGVRTSNGAAYRAEPWSSAPALLCEGCCTSAMLPCPADAWASRPARD